MSGRLVAAMKRTKGSEGAASTLGLGGGFGPLGGPNAIQLDQQLGEEPVPQAGRGGGAVRPTPAPDGVDLVKEEDGRGSGAGPLKDPLQGLLRFTDPLVQQLGPLDRHKVHPALCRNGLC